MLMIEERAENARKRVEEAVAEQPSAREGEDTRELPAAIGELILQWFPELFASEGGNEETLKLLKMAPQVLADDQPLTEDLKRRAGWPHSVGCNV